jgi:hypothetical protein
MMKRCNPRGNIYGASYESSTKGVKNRDDMIYRIRSIIICIIFLSIFS